jgi:hypothetical protein
VARPIAWRISPRGGAPLHHQRRFPSPSWVGISNAPRSPHRPADRPVSARRRRRLCRASARHDGRGRCAGGAAGGLAAAPAAAVFEGRGFRPVRLCRRRVSQPRARFRRRAGRAAERSRYPDRRYPAGRTCRAGAGRGGRRRAPSRSDPRLGAAVRRLRPQGRLEGRGHPDPARVGRRQPAAQRAGGGAVPGPRAAEDPRPFRREAGRYRRRAGRAGGALDPRRAGSSSISQARMRRWRSAHSPSSGWATGRSSTGSNARSAMAG